MTEEKYDAIYEALEHAKDNLVVSLWNDYCDNINDPDGVVYDMYDLDELLKPSVEANGVAWLIDRTRGNHFSDGDDYWGFNGYGNLFSFSSVDDEESPIDFGELVNYLEENGDDSWGIVSNEDLMDAFLDKYCDTEEKRDMAIKYFDEDASIDLVTDDWDYAAEEIFTANDEDLDNE